jgi:cardiolipin synthase
VLLLLGTAVTHLTGIQIDVTPTIWGKGTTALQLSYVFLVIFLTWLDLDLSMLTPLLVAVVGFTLASGFHYLYRGYRNANLPLSPK